MTQIISQNVTKKGFRQALEVPTLSITDKPIFLTGHPQEIIQQAGILSDLVEANPKQAIKALNQLANKYPHNSLLMVLLAKAYAANNQEDLQNKVRTENYQHNPNNLISRCDYARLCIEQQRFSEVPEIFNNIFDLTALYPELKAFSTEEAVLFYSTICAYFIGVKQFGNAEICIETLENVDKDDQSAQVLAAILYTKIIEKLSHLLPEEALNDIFSDDEEEDCEEDDDCDDEDDSIPF